LNRMAVSEFVKLAVPAVPRNDVSRAAAAGASTSLAIALLVLRRYIFNEIKAPEVFHAPIELLDPESRRIVQECRILMRDYWPRPIAEFSGYLATFWAGLWAVLPTSVIPGEVERLTLQDGGTVSLHWSAPPESLTSDRLVLVLPGLNNESGTHFVQSSMRYLSAHGFDAVALNYRGVAGLPLTSPRVFCSDSWSDLPEILDHIVRKRPGARVFGMGYSLGGGILAKYLSEVGSQTPLKGLVTVGAPLDYSACAAALESGWKKLGMNFLTAFGLKLFMLGPLLKASDMHGVCIPTCLRARTLRELEKASFCQMHGYTDTEDYYAQNSPGAHLSKVRVPTLVLHAADDPVVSVKTLPMAEMRRNPRFIVAITRRGGHLGWGHGGVPGSAAWPDVVSAEFFSACTVRSRL